MCQLFLHKYPQSSHLSNSVRSVMFVQIKKNVSIIEMTREATSKEIDDCKLIYCGHGYFDEKNVKRNMED
ncbi:MULTISPECIES: hypothetical protein [Enterococcus]|uniref:hypothetical protein n=1 Tax=Enterococcus TaxID=1350 RepID=UPI001162C23B|nr:hypothetical protein [Enterococcus avium]AYQ24185.1 hypothetical protein AUF16_06085 [Enterococcus avium]